MKSWENVPPPAAAQVAVIVNVTLSTGVNGKQKGAPAAGPRQVILGPARSVAWPRLSKVTVVSAGKAVVVMPVIVSEVTAVALSTSNVTEQTGGVLLPDTGPVTVLPKTIMGQTAAGFDVCACAGRIMALTVGLYQTAIALVAPTPNSSFRL